VEFIEWLKVAFLLGFETERGKEQLPELIMKHAL